MIAPIPIGCSVVLAHLAADGLDAAEDREHLAAGAAVLGAEPTGEHLRLRKHQLTISQLSRLRSTAQPHGVHDRNFNPPEPGCHRSMVAFVLFEGFFYRLGGLRDDVFGSIDVWSEVCHYLKSIGPRVLLHEYYALLRLVDRKKKWPGILDKSYLLRHASDVAREGGCDSGQHMRVGV